MISLSSYSPIFFFWDDRLKPSSIWFLIHTYEHQWFDQYNSQTFPHVSSVCWSSLDLFVPTNPGVLQLHFNLCSTGTLKQWSYFSPCFRWGINTSQKIAMESCFLFFSLEHSLLYFSSKYLSDIYNRHWNFLSKFHTKK